MTERQYRITVRVEDREDTYTTRGRGETEFTLPITASDETVGSRTAGAARLLNDNSWADYPEPKDPFVQAAAPGVLDA